MGGALTGTSGHLQDCNTTPAPVQSAPALLSVFGSTALGMYGLAGAIDSHQVLGNTQLSVPLPGLGAVAPGPVIVCTFRSTDLMLREGWEVIFQIQNLCGKHLLGWPDLLSLS